MYRSVTRAIEVNVTSAFLPEESSPKERRYFFSYTVMITNTGAETVQLKARHWFITNGNGQVQEVRGEGVIGQQPVLAPGEHFRYTSGCPLDTPDGIMHGIYHMANAEGERFQIKIPAFPLDSPHVRRVLN